MSPSITFSLLLLWLSCSSCKFVSSPGGSERSQQTWERVYRVLGDHPVVDGHNDFPMGIRELLRNDISKLDFDSDLTVAEPWASYWANHIDLPRMRKGQMGGQCFLY